MTRNFLSNIAGSTAIEYAVIVAVVGAALAATLPTMSTDFETVMAKLSNGLSFTKIIIDDHED